MLPDIKYIAITIQLRFFLKICKEVIIAVDSLCNAPCKQAYTVETLRNPASDVAKQDLCTISNTHQMPRLHGSGRNHVTGVFFLSVFIGGR